MKIEFIDDAVSGGGHGFLEFSGVPFPAGPLAFAILRASDHQYVAGDGSAWGGEKVFLPIGEEPGPDGVLMVRVGPGLVNSLNSQDTYGITLKGSDGHELAGRLKIRAITYSADAMLDNTGRKDAEKMPEKPQRDGSDLVSHSLSAAAGSEAPQQAAGLELETQAPLIMPQPEKKRIRIWRWLVLLLLLAGCGLWYLLDPRRNGGDAPLPDQESPVKIEEPVQKENEAAQSGPSINFQGKNITPGEAARLSRELPQTTNSEKDAIYRLYYFAASHGEPGVLLDFGACLDPSLPEWGTISKDAPLAFSIYEKAGKTEPEKAQRAREHLLNWLRENAGKNNQARIWLEELSK